MTLRGGRKSSSSLSGPSPRGGRAVHPDELCPTAPRRAFTGDSAPWPPSPDSAAAGRGPLGRGPRVSSRGFPRGGSIGLPGAVGWWPGLGNWSTPISPRGLGLPRWLLAGRSTGGGPGSCEWRSLRASGPSQRWMWPLGSPVGSGSLFFLLARQRAGLVWAWTVLGPAGPSPGRAPTGGSVRCSGASAAPPRPNKVHTSAGRSCPSLARRVP